MKIAIDARLLTGAYTGDRTYWRGLLTALIRQLEVSGEAELLLFTDRSLPVGVLPSSHCWREIVIPARSGRWWSYFTLPKAVKQTGACVAHVQYSVSPLFKTPVVTTVHDVSFLVNPKWFPFKDRWLLRLSVPASCRRASWVITVSESSRQDILRYLRLPPEKVVATLLGLPEGFEPVNRQEAQAWVQKHYGVMPPYMLAVGVLQPRKNWGMALYSVAKARAQGCSDLKLLLTGKPGWAAKALRELKFALGADEWLIETGYVPDEHLIYLYNASEALLFPSFYEGFGLPPLEAMACGTPVIASNSSALPEVVERGGLLLPPDEPGLWANAIVTILNEQEYTARLRAQALERAREFSWDETARLTMEVYRGAARV